MATVSAINPAPVIINQKIDEKQQGQPQKTGYNVKQTLGVLSLPFVVGEGTAIKSFFENKGQIAAYENVLTKFAAGSAERQGVEDCINLVKKNMQANKKGGLALLATMVVCSAVILIDNACKKSKADKTIPSLKNDTAKTEPKLITNA